MEGEVKGRGGGDRGTGPGREVKRRAGEEGREEREGDKGGIMEDRRGEERRAKNLIPSGIDHGAHAPINTHSVGFFLQPLSLRLTPITRTNTADQRRGLAPHYSLRGREQKQDRLHDNRFMQKVTVIIVSIKVNISNFLYVCG